MTAGRWLNREDLARHLGIKPSGVAAKVRAGLLPAPSYHLGQQLPRWDREAVDRLMEGGQAGGWEDAIREMGRGKTEDRAA